MGVRKALDRVFSDKELMALDDLIPGWSLVIKNPRRHSIPPTSKLGGVASDEKAGCRLLES